MPKISIIIPCYNSERYIESTIHSVLSQTFTDWECLVVDDGSTDQSVARIQHITDERIHLIQKANGGSASARQLGLAHAQGEYIQFLDSDDLLSPSKLEKQLAYMQQHDLDVSYTGFMHYQEEPDGQATYAAPTAWSLRPLFSFHFTMLTRWGIDFSIAPFCFMYRRQFLLDNHLDYSIPVRQREDWYFHLMVGTTRCAIGDMRNFNGGAFRHHSGSKTDSYIKMIDGNTRFLAYLSQQLHGWDALLLAYRISAELCMMVGRCIKYGSAQSIRCLFNLLANGRSTLLTLIALFLLPVSVCIIIIRSIYLYTHA